MIATHTFNPSVDITYNIDSLKVGEVHRATTTIKNPGGKGINVTKVLHILGAKYCAYGYLGGGHGKWIGKSLQQGNIQSDFTFFQGETRQCIAINDGINQTEILERGPIISAEAQAKYLEKLKLHSLDTTVVTISGSTPQMEGNSNLLHMKNVLECYTQSYNIVDTNAQDLKRLIKEALPIHCIKPNLSEFETLINKKGLSIEECIQHLNTHENFKHLDVFLTLGEAGAVIKWKNEIYRATLAQRKIVNPVGSGDATVAGIAYGVHECLEPLLMIRLAIACGTSNALQKQTGHVDIKQVEKIKNEVEVERL
ncbi:1-phosphofructokinase family hexose kinase [Staphylococcus agnetis]|uniref:1-phosphofructokinase family hexose kinase n=1 Tax=Staphylococcus agnetis TaxID=985762 RepID=UPI000D1A1BE4|nr:hexose kinase [Staphylococcus agnetis]PTH58246.1 tagatose-6-phosphate kinase [Staphylococcus agnetis]